MDNNTNTIIGLGEVLWDCFEDKKTPGGAPANFAYVSTQLGAKGVVASRVGTDDFGDEIIEYIQSNGLNTDLVQRDAEHPTGTVQITTDETGSASYVFPPDVAWDFLELNEPLAELARSANAVCFGTLAQRSETSCRTIHGFLQQTPQDCLNVFDVNLRQDFYSDDVVRRSLLAANVFKLNDDEVEPVCEMLSVTRIEDEKLAAVVLYEYNVNVMCITRGPDGCTLFTPSEDPDRPHRIDVPGQNVDVADTVGAGDAFTAGLVFGLLNEWPMEKVGQFANRIGGLVASKHGAMADIKDDVNHIIHDFDERLA